MPKFVLFFFMKLTPIKNENTNLRYRWIFIQRFWSTLTGFSIVLIPKSSFSQVPTLNKMFLHLWKTYILLCQRVIWSLGNIRGDILGIWCILGNEYYTIMSCFLFVFEIIWFHDFWLNLNFPKYNHNYFMLTK